MATIYLVRHGQASFGAEDYDKLSGLGCRQSQILGEYFRDCGIRLDAAYSGDLLRQRDTARLTLLSQTCDVPLHVDARFNEIDNDAQIRVLLPEVIRNNTAVRELTERGVTSSKDYQKLIDAVFNYWVSPACRDDRVQSWGDYSRGVRDALSDVMRLQGSGKRIAIFTSGGTIATIVAHVLGLEGEKTYQLYEPMMNCSVSQLFYSGSRVSLSYFNDCSFLRLAGAGCGEDLVSYR